MRKRRLNDAEVAISLGKLEAGAGESAEAATRTYGWCAFVVGCFLVWFAIWTIECNFLVLTSQHYPLFLLAPVLPTLLVLVFGRFRHRIIAHYSSHSFAAVCAEPTLSIQKTEWLLFAVATILALVAADLGNRLPTAIFYIVSCAIASAMIGFCFRRAQHQPRAVLAPEIGLRLSAFIALLLVLYYFAHHPDADDANYVNLALGAQRTHGAVFQLDTMLGDGPSPIHLPTYKFHSFELLAAVLSTYLRIAPIAVFHLLLPAILLPLFAMVLMLMFVPIAGRYWFAASLFVIAFLFFNLGTLGGWGIHGILRFYQGKGFLVSALLPLMAALSARWFLRGQPIDLAAMLLIAICSLGFSANGLYGAPAAAALPAAAFLAAGIRSRVIWMRAMLLSGAFSYLAIVAFMMLALHLALPSENVERTFAINQLNFVASYGILGRLTLTVMAFSGIGLIQTGKAATASLVYFPLAMLLILNPVSWALISAMTGNLGFRIFWSLPVPALIALTATAAIRLVNIRSELVLNSIAGLALAGSMTFASVGGNQSAVSRIAWHLPDLKINRADYDLAGRLALMTKPNCRILAPEQYSMQLSMMRGAPYPVFVRKLYLIHYRFTLPPEQLRLRSRLRLVVDGPSPVVPPRPTELSANGIPIGTVAVREDAPSRTSAAELADSLRLDGPVREGPLLIWTGDCSGR